MRALGAALEGSLQRALHQRRRRVPVPPLQIASFRPESLFANGELGTVQDPADRSRVFTDVAGTVLAMAENDLIARINDQSPNGAFAQRVNSTLRPKLAYLAGSYRRAVDYDGIDDALATTLPAMGSNCTLVLAKAGVGAIVTTGMTVNAGALQSNTDNCGLILINRALTPAEDASVRLWARQHAGVEDEYSVPYGSDPDEILDVFHSCGHAKGPIIFMVHGGGWRNGSKASPNVTKNKLLHWLPMGFTFVSINYKLDVGTDPIDQARSTAKALAWVQDHAAGWGCDPSQIVIMGHSAGGHLVALVSASAAIRATAGVRPWLGTIVIDGAAYDVKSIMERPGHLTLYDEPWGTDPSNEAHWIAGSPTFQLTQAPPPMLLITSTDSNPGEADINVGPFADAVNALGGSATILHTAFDHAGTNNEMGAPGTYTDDIDAFLATLGI